MDLMQAYNAYRKNRAENAECMRNELAGFSHADQYLGHVFWSNAVLDTQENIHTLYGKLPAHAHFNASSFTAADPLPAVERKGGLFRLQVSSHYILDLSSFDDKDGYFRHLSPKNRKKLRWLSNAVPALGCRIVPLTTQADFAMFEELYSTQFPKYPAGCEANKALWNIYRKFIEQGKSYSFILLSPDNKALAAALGYIEGNSYNYTHLTRYSGEYDKYSPGYFLTYNIILQLIQDHPEVDFFFMGPGYYDYKRALGGEAMAVFRCLRHSFVTAFSLLRMYFRAWKQRKKSSR